MKDLLNKQFLIESDGFKETFDNEKNARRIYGKLKKEVKENEEGFLKMSSKDEKGEWILLQEVSFGKK